MERVKNVFENIRIRGFPKIKSKSQADEDALDTIKSSYHFAMDFFPIQRLTDEVCERHVSIAEESISLCDDE